MEASARSDQFTLLILPADRVPAAIAEARTAADSDHFCPEGEDWSWRDEIQIGVEVVQN